MNDEYIENTGYPKEFWDGYSASTHDEGAYQKENSAYPSIKVIRGEGSQSLAPEDWRFCLEMHSPDDDRSCCSADSAVRWVRRKH